MNNIREKFEAWFTGEVDTKTRRAMMEKDDAGYYKFQSAYNAWNVWQAATEQSQKEIAEKDARIAELEDYKNSVIDQFVTAHHSYDESISAYENISKLIAYHQDIALDPKVSSVAARWVTQIEGLQAREKVLVEALQNLVEDISKTHGNYTYEQAWINADEALVNVINEKKGEVK